MAQLKRSVVATYVVVQTFDEALVIVTALSKLSDTNSEEGTHNTG